MGKKADSGKREDGAPGRAAPTVVVEPADLAVPARGGRFGVVLRSLAGRLQGARLCYGEPVTTDGRTVITVARVSARGGFGVGVGGERGTDEGGGGGGELRATPVGYIELTADGSRFVPIDDPTADARMVRAVASSLGGLWITLAIARRLRPR